MRILLFGGSGQLGFEFIRRATDLNFEVISPVLTELDIGALDQVLAFSKRSKPDVIVNCAAYTAVDRAEEESAAAFRVNAEGAQNVAVAARDLRARLLHVSTDYVYDGTATEPITENAATNPLNVYGASKLEGENRVRAVLPDSSLIVRTSSLHGQRGENFVHTMIKLFRERDEVRVVDDQWMCPTWAGWLAEVILDLSRMEVGGVVHACGRGVCSWYEFASAIDRFAGSKIERQPRCRVERTSVSQFPRPAKRPRFSAMDCARLTAILGRAPITWEEGLRAHLNDIGYLAERA